MSKDVKLCSFIVRESIVPDIQATDRNGVVRELVQSLVKSGRLDAGIAEELTAEVIKREMKGSTGFGKGVAVPHAKHSSLTEMIGVVGRSAAGVDFASLDKQPVYSFVLLISPMSEPEKHLGAMNAVFSNLQMDMFRKFLRQADTQQKIWELLEEADQAAPV
jgi:PTS system fructose-specific IIA component/PTS system nitrogen regulatory IIA component